MDWIATAWGRGASTRLQAGNEKLSNVKKCCMIFDNKPNPPPDFICLLFLVRGGLVLVVF